MATTISTTTSTLPTHTAALRISGYPVLLFSGWLWQMARWGISFVGAFLANDFSGSARLVQMTGVALWAPLLLGGIVGGVVSDRFDRRRTVISQFVVAIPLALLLAWASVTDRLELWMVYPFMVVIGVGWVVDMTSRRALIYDIVGPTSIDNAMSYEMLSSSSGLALGALLGGTVIEAIGIGAAFVFIAGLLSAALVLFTFVPRTENRVRPTSTGGQDLRDGFRMLRTERGLLSVLGVTACVNFFYFSFTPLVQLVASELDVGPALVGLLASMIGLGMMTGSALMILLRPTRRGVAYVIGSFSAMGLLLGFVATDNYVITAVFLFLSAVGMGFFGATQGVLTMASVSADRRGRSLGLLSMAIGVLPIGMILLGEVAEIVGAPDAIALSTTVGGITMLLWLLRHPETLSMVSTKASVLTPPSGHHS